MRHRSALVAVASVQLTAQLTGHVVALRRRHPFDVPFLTGSPEHIVRDWLWFGTALSGPPYLLAAHAWAITRLLRGPDDRARWVLQWVGTGLTFGYLSERLCRARLRPGNHDAVETPVVAIGWASAVAMSALGRVP